jgi:hypothetical protein
MAKSKSTRSKSRGSNIAGQSKSPRRPKGSMHRAKGEAAARHVTGEENREPSSDSQYGGRNLPRGHRPEELVDEETGAQSRRPGGTGDASLGDDDGGPEGPAR